MATTANPRAHRRSLRCRPGVTKLQSWYSQTGVASSTPATPATFSCMTNGSATPVNARVISRPSASAAATTVSKGARITAKISS